MKTNSLEVVKYIIFGVLTTIVNIVVFLLLKNYCPIIVSNIIAWFCSVVFAYVTNALYVFDERQMSIKQFIEFMVSRISTLIIETIIIYIMINLLTINLLITKIVANIIVIILNFVLSKLFVFKKGN